MIRLTLVVITLVVISLMFMGISYADTWYRESFDNFKDGDIAGQKGWEILPLIPDMNSSTIQADVAFGDTGKSLLVEGGQYVTKDFPGKHGDTQHISFLCRKDSEPGGRINHYTGGGEKRWEGAAVFSAGLPNMLRAFNEGSHDIVAVIELEKWLHFHVVLDFKKEAYDIYIDGEQLVENFGFRGEDHRSLDWWFFGSSHLNEGGGPLVSYVDNISIGTGKGDPTKLPEMAVSSSGKLATTWAELKR